MLNLCNKEFAKLGSPFELLKLVSYEFLNALTHFIFSAIEIALKCISFVPELMIILNGSSYYLNKMKKNKLVLI